MVIKASQVHHYKKTMTMTKENIHFDNISFEFGTAGVEVSQN